MNKIIVATFVKTENKNIQSYNEARNESIKTENNSIEVYDKSSVSELLEKIIIG